MILTFEKANADDIAPVFDFCKEIIDKYEDLQNIDYERVLAWVRKKISDNIDEYRRVLADGALAGYYRTCFENGKTELDDLYILPKHQRKGIGTAVIEKCCAESELPVFLYVFIRNTEAVKLYKRLGFEVVETVRDSRYIMQRNKIK